MSHASFGPWVRACKISGGYVATVGKHKCFRIRVIGGWSLITRPGACMLT